MMKMKLLLLLTCLCVSSMNVMAEIKLPKGSFTAAQLADASKAAVDQKKPVAYLYTNTDTTCPLAEGASKGFLDAVGRKCILVYVPAKGNKYGAKLSEGVRKALQQGQFVPKLVLTASDGSQAQVFTYEAYRDDSKKTVKEIKKLIQTLST